MTARKGSTDLNYIINKLQGLAASGKFDNVDLAHIWQLIGSGSGALDHYFGNNIIDSHGHIFTPTKSTFYVFLSNNLADQNVSKQNITPVSTTRFIISSSGYYLFDISFTVNRELSPPGALTFYIYNNATAVYIARQVCTPSYVFRDGFYWSTYQFLMYSELNNLDNYQFRSHLDPGELNLFLAGYPEYNPYLTPDNICFNLNILRII